MRKRSWRGRDPYQRGLFLPADPPDVRISMLLYHVTTCNEAREIERRGFGTELHRIGKDERGQALMTAGVAFGERATWLGQEINPDAPPAGLEVLALEVPRSVVDHAIPIREREVSRSWCVLIEVANSYWRQNSQDH